MEEKFIISNLNLSAALLREVYSARDNVLVSPVSIASALIMCANGAGGKTQEEIVKLLGDGLDLMNYNMELHNYLTSLPSTDSCSFCFANSIWLAAFLQLNPAFAEVNKALYGAETEALTFDEAAVAKINGWVSEKTAGMIPEVIDSLSPEALMYVINALAFDGKWHQVYTEADVRPAPFTNAAGETYETDCMFSTENRYFETADATGFMKPYAGHDYSFLAILPKDRTLDDYMTEFDGQKLAEVLAAFSRDEVKVMLPKFSGDFSAILNNILNKMGVQTAFSGEADFTKISNTPLTIGEVIHKTFIEVNEHGTRAAAVTSVMMKLLGAASRDVKQVYLDRPFIYAILDNTHLLPVFIGAVTDVR